MNKGVNWKSAWIVGGSSGLGAEISKQLANDNVDVYVSARSKDALDELCRPLVNMTALPLDITDLNACHDTVSKLMIMNGGMPNLIILNAAIYWPMDTGSFDPEKIKSMMDVNYIGSVNMLDAIIKSKKDDQKTTVALVASPSGWSGLPGGAGYGPTKAAMINLAESIKAELEEESIDIRVINPGFIKTRLTEMNDFEMPKLMEPDDAARYAIKGLKTSKFDIAFPNPFLFSLKVISMLPYWLYFKLMRKIVKNRKG